MSDNTLAALRHEYATTTDGERMRVIERLIRNGFRCRKCERESEHLDALHICDRCRGERS